LNLHNERAMEKDRIVLIHCLAPLSWEPGFSPALSNYRFSR
jgi:hypothetical protein